MAAPPGGGLADRGRPVVRRSRALAAGPRRPGLLGRAPPDLDDEDVAWLHLLVADWQIVADLSFADLVLWLPDRDGSGFWAGAQMRATTGHAGSGAAAFVR